MVDTMVVSSILNASRESGPSATYRALIAGRRVVVSSLGPTYALKTPSYHRLDLRATRRIILKRGELRAYLDIFNAR